METTNKTVAKATPEKKVEVKTPDISLADKAQSLPGMKGKYVLVSDRIKYFNTTYKNGSIKTQILKDEGNVIQFQARVTPDLNNPMRYYVGHAEEIRGVGFVNKTSAVENAETSAIGRALAMMGIGVIDSVASLDEINIAKGKEVKMAKINTEVKVDKPTDDFEI